MKMSKRGFALVELMITLVILATLMTIGYPLYSAQTEKARRVEARSGLLKLALAQERHDAMFAGYATTTAMLNYGQDGIKDGTNDTYAYDAAVSDMDHDGDGSPDHYNIALSGDATTFLFTASAKGVQSGDEDCWTFTINQLGEKLAKDKAGGDQTDRCW